METSHGIPYHDLELDVSMASDISSLFDSQDDLGASWKTSNVSNPVRTNYLGFNTPNLSTSDDSIALDSGTEHLRPATQELEPAFEPTFRGFRREQEVSQTFQMPDSSRPVSHPPRPVSTTENTTTAIPHILSPIHTNFDCDGTSLEPYPSLSTDSDPPSPVSSKSSLFMNLINNNTSSLKRNHDSIKVETDFEQLPGMTPSPTRRRKSEHVEPSSGSARAIYLEKNRKAASKCRNKQKQQQEELVESARDVERKNKTLKAQVGFLQDDLRGLMDIVGQHSQCPDNRLRTYVQREADKLAGVDSKSPVLEDDSLEYVWPSELE